MIMLTTLFGFIETSIGAAFTWAENIFGVFGITLIVLFIAMIATSFFARHFIGSFLR